MVDGFVAALASSPASTWIRTEPWAWPVLELLHIAGFALLVGGMALVDAAVLAGRRAPDPRALERFARPFVRGGLALALVTGLALFAGRPIEYVGNPAFLAKLALVGVAIANALAFHARDGIVKMDVLARLQAAVSIVLWFLVLALGRFIAYV